MKIIYAYWELLMSNLEHLSHFYFLHQSNEYKFNKKGENKIEIIENKPLRDMSNMFIFLANAIL